MARRVAVIGAGPMGLEAALGAIERGFAVTVHEAGRVGASLRRWGPTRFFTPVAMNLSPRARAVLGADAPPPDALLTGPETAEVLERLAERPPLAGLVRVGTRVVSVGRRRMTRHDHPGHPIRGERPFRLLLETAAGEEEAEADVVLDASGVYGWPLPVGCGGPALGEREAAPFLARTLGELHDRRAAMAGEPVAVVGSGHSAANAIGAIAEWIAGGEGPASVRWIVRSRRQRPCVEVPEDPLPERMRIVRGANELASRPPPWLTVIRGQTVHRLGVRGDRLVVECSRGERFDVAHLASLTGYRPDLAMLDELSLDVAPATSGAGGLWRAVSRITDCTSVPDVAPDDLHSGEPGFYTIGHKSYGRSSTFLLGTGRLQLEAILDREAGA